MKLLASELSLDISDTNLSRVPVPLEFQPQGRDIDIFSLPYDEAGCLVGGGAPRRLLDLSIGAQLVVTAGPDAGKDASVTGKDEDGHWILRIGAPGGTGWRREARLGNWWIPAAVCGEVPSIPVVTK